VKRVLTACPYCGTGCNFYLMVDDHEKIIGVVPSTENVVNKGQLCIKGWNSFQFVQHPDRLTHPLIKRNGVFERISWEEATRVIVKTLKDLQAACGNDAVAFFSSAKTTNEENYLMMKLARAAFKTNNVDHCARLCHSSTVTGLAGAFGSGAMTNSISCVEEADVIFVIGSNTTEQHPLIGTRVIKAKRNGAKLVVADNRIIRLARMADLHIRHKNGTDVYLLNAMMQVIIEEGLANRTFVEARTEGYEELKATVLDRKYSPDQASIATGVPADQIRQAARMFAKAPKAMIIYSMGITQHSHGVDNVRSCAHLAMLTGHIGISGTGVNPLRGQNNVQGACDMGALPDVYTGYQAVTNPDIRKKFEAAWHVDSLPDHAGETVTTAINAAHEGRIKALYIMGENPMVSDPDTNHVREALKNLDLLVVQDIFMTPTAELAHIVLPGVTYAEKDGTFTSTERRVQRVRKAIEPLGDSRQDWQILCDLAREAGYPHMVYPGGPRQVMEEINALTPSYQGITYDRIEKLGLQWPCLGPGHPGTRILHQERFTKGKGTFMATEYRPSLELPDADYPFVLTTGRVFAQYHTGTMTRRTQLLEREEPEAFVEIHPNNAKDLGIRNDESVSVYTRRGEVRAKARVTDVVPPGVLFMPFHFQEGSANVLTNNVLDPLAKIPEYKVCAANVKKSG
jgi:formate dehydrogenase alpha subunit